MENSYQMFNLRRAELLELAQKQHKISVALDGNATADAETLTGAQKTEGAISRLKSDVFNVLVMGCFSSGKSTFLNALLGERVLPYSHDPCTGVLTFINYADDANKKIVLYPKKGMGENGNDKPFEIAEGDLKQALSNSVALPKGCVKEEATETSRYEKAEFFYPLPLCKNGVRIIDSVGLNDPAARDAITLEFAQNADAVIYCIPSIAPYNAKDGATIAFLKGLGLGGSVFFVLTYFDFFEREAENDGVNVAEEMDSIAKKLIPLAALKKDGVCFVDSEGALKGEPKAKKRLDDIAAALEKFLVSQKGESRLKSNFALLKSVNDDAARRIPEKLKLLQKGVKDIEALMKKTEAPLRNREKECENILKDVESDGVIVTDTVACVARHCIDKLKHALLAEIDDYKFVAGNLDARAKELSEHVRGFIEKYLIEMQAKIDEKIESEMAQLSRRVKRNIENFSGKIVELKNDVGLSDESVNELSKTAEINYFETLGLGAASGVAIGFLGLTLAPAAVVSIVGYFSVAWYKKWKAKRKLKDSVKAECEKIFAESEEVVAKIVGKYAERIEKLKAQIDKELRSQIATIRKDIGGALDSQSKDKRSREAEIKKLETLAKDAEEIGRALSAFAGKMKF